MAKPRRRRLDLAFFIMPDFWLSLGICLFVIVMYVLSRPEIGRLQAPDMLEIMEAKTLDVRFRLRGAINPGDDIVIIAVDEKTEDDLGRWHSLGRLWLAQLVNILHQGNASVVGFDLTLAEPDANIGVAVAESLEAEYRKAAPDALTAYPALLAALEQAKTAHDYDRQLADAIRQAGNVVLGIYHFWDAASAAHLTPERHAAYQQMISRVMYDAFDIGDPPPLRLITSFGVEPNLPLFSDAAKSFGHFNHLTDRDGVIRFTPLLLDYQGNYYPSFALEVAQTHLRPPMKPVIHLKQISAGVGLIDHIVAPPVTIPCDEQGELLINYYGPAFTFPYYSLSDVLSGKIPAYKFGDKIVLVGFTSYIYQDLHSTPFRNDTFPGVEINATIVANIVKNDFITRPQWTTLVDVLLILGLRVAIGIVRYRKSPLWGTWAALVGLALIIGLGDAAFLFWKIWLNVTYPMLFLLLDYIALTSYKYLTEERQERLLKHAFEHYVSASVVTHLLQNKDQLKLGGERKELTAFFSDIRGFTKISEHMTPEELVKFLNEYLSAMTGVVLKYDGTLDKYMGDAIMAFYGAPVAQPDHALRACKTAVDMMIHLQELQVGWKARGLPPLNIGIGIHSGEMNVGNMGSWERFDYTIIGDNVNLASRLEGLNKQYGTNIVISEFTYQHCAQAGGEALTVRELDRVCVKGKNEPVTIYELMGYGTLYAQKKELIEKFEAGLTAYKQRDWAQALAAFQEVLQLDPQDHPAQLYIARCQEYQQQPPPDDWDGVFVMKTK